jgi:hypothetical protein
MRLIVVLRIGKESVSTEVSCGSGDKTFKWLALVAAQKYTNSVPNGTLRCRDGFNGVTPHAQHHPIALSLDSGESPPPTAFLSEFLKDGDRVTVDLTSEARVSRIGYAESTSWFEDGFKLSGNDTCSRNNQVRLEEKESDTDVFFVDTPDSRFMRVLLSKQMIDDYKVMAKLDSDWTMIRRSLPQLSDINAQKLKKIFFKYYCYLLELYAHYVGFEDKLDLTLFTNMITDAHIFDSTTIGKIPIVFDRVISSREGLSKIDFPGLLTALIICAQMQHVNTLDASATVFDPSGALRTVLESRMLPLIVHLGLNHVTKSIFCSPELLEKIKENHPDLVLVFEKTAAKSGVELPVVLHIEHMADLLVDVGLLKVGEGRIELVVSFLVAARSGLTSGPVYTREPSITTESVDKQRAQNLRRGEDFDFVENIITYPEFVEVCARAGCHKFARNVLESDNSVMDKLSAYRHAMERGVTECAAFIRKSADQAKSRK